MKRQLTLAEIPHLLSHMLCRLDVQTALVRSNKEVRRAYRLLLQAIGRRSRYVPKSVLIGRYCDTTPRLNAYRRFTLLIAKRREHFYAQIMMALVYRGICTL